jgi:hypothetical protein
LKLNGRSTVTGEEKVYLFADTLQDILTANPDVDRNFSEATENTVRNFLSQSSLPSVRKTNYQEIGWIIPHLKFYKGAGSDGIQNVVLKNLTLSALKFIATVYNASITNNYFPSQWKVAEIIMLSEPDKDHSSPLNYRPISLLNSLVKVFEKILL